MIVELRAVPGCPNLSATRDLLRACLTEAGLPATFAEALGDHPSPSVLIDGVDVSGGDPAGPAACVLTPPTADQIFTALRRAVAGSAYNGADALRGQGGAVVTVR